MSTTAIDSTTTSTTSSYKTSALSSLTAEDFLKLFLTEIQNQDPTNPTDTKDMMSEFSALTQLSQNEQTNAYLESLVSSSASSGLSSAVSYLNKTITYSDDTITVSNAAAASGSFTLAGDASSVAVSVYNSDGNKVSTINLGGLSAGTQSFTWNCQNSSGKTASDGTYTFAVSAKDSSGKTVTATTGGTATVTGVTYQNGTTYLDTSKGEIPLSSVTHVS